MTNHEITQELSKYADCIKKTTTLAQVIKGEEDTQISKIEDLSFDIEDLQLKGAELELYKYLCALDFESLAVIQTLMSIGRDYSCVEDDGTYNYHNVRKYMDDLGWPDDKEDTANYLSEKFPLAEYLMEGCKKIGFTL